MTHMLANVLVSGIELIGGAAVEVGMGLAIAGLLRTMDARRRSAALRRNGSSVDEGQR